KAAFRDILVKEPVSVQLTHVEAQLSVSTRQVDVVEFLYLQVDHNTHIPILRTTEERMLYDVQSAVSGNPLADPDTISLFLRPGLQPTFSDLIDHRDKPRGCEQPLLLGAVAEDVLKPMLHQSVG